MSTEATPGRGTSAAGAAVTGGEGLFDMAGASAARAVADAEAEQRDLAAALRRSHRRAHNYQAAALSEPQTAAAW